MSVPVPSHPVAASVIAAPEGAAPRPADWVLVVLLTVLGLLPALASDWIGLLPAAGVASLLGVAIGVSLPRRQLPFVALALLASGCFLLSELVPAPARYLPLLLPGSAAAAGMLLAWNERLYRPTIPPPAALVPVCLYAAWAFVTTVSSTDRGTSLLYAMGIAATFVFVFGVAPDVLGAPWARRAIAVTVAGVGVVLAGFSLLLWATGPLHVLGRDLGLYVITEISVLGHATGLVVARASGPFAAPATPSLVLAIALAGALAARSWTVGRPRRLLTAAVVLILVGLALTMARAGWLAAGVAGGVVFVAQLFRRRFDGLAAVATLCLFGLLVALSLNLVSADARYDITAQRYGPTLAGLLPGADASSDSLEVRGGTSLSGRGEIWAASLQAIRQRPIVGSGPGTNPAALAPYLTGSNARYRGLTSHNTWLRAAVEMGLPGGALLILFQLAVLAIALRRLVRERTRFPSEDVALLAIFVGLMAGMIFESFLLGGLNYQSLVWAVAAALLVPAVPILGATRRRAGAPPPRR